MDTSFDENKFKKKLAAFTGKAGLIISILLCPPVFAFAFATGNLLDHEKSLLWIFSVLLALLSFYTWKKKNRVSPGKSLLFFSILLLLSLEIIFRLYVHVFYSHDEKAGLTDKCNNTYPENTAYTGHPFLQFTGRPSRVLKGNRALTGVSPFNNFGFTGADFNYDKKSTFIRVACLGESTTADGWPQFLENYLNDHRSNGNYRYEVMNFAHAFWTSAHGLSNMLLNITDFNPDYIVIHHGWNENLVRDAMPGEFRGDYFHDLKPFDQPVIYDRYPIRYSLIYRVLKFKYNPSPDWLSLQNRIHRKRKFDEPLFDKPEELMPFRRNMENIINIAMLHHIKVIITTIPHSMDPKIELAYTTPSLDQCNAITRELAHTYKETTVFVDLDSLITGKHDDIFTDLAHINDGGRAMKASFTGEALIADSKPIAEEIVKHADASAARENDIYFYSTRIRCNSDWMNDIKNKALLRMVSVDEMVKMDAEWLYRQDSAKIAGAVSPH